MSGGIATLLQPPSPLSVPCRPGYRERELSPDYDEHCARPTGGLDDTIFAPTPLVKISRFQDGPEPGTPKAMSGSEIESILAEKGMTGENIICAFPKIQSSEDFTRLVTQGEMPNSPLLGMGRCMSMSGLDDMPLGFPMRNRSLLDLSSHEFEVASQYEEEEEVDSSMAGPPLRSLNPLKDILYKRKVVLLSAAPDGKPAPPPRVPSRTEFEPQKKTGVLLSPLGAELGLNKLSPPMDSSEY